MSDKVPKELRKLDHLTLAPLSEIFRELDIDAQTWDALIVGDGSGSGWNMGCGWAAVMIDRCNLRRLFKGAMDPGTVGIGELEAYLHAMMWYSRGPGKARLHDLQAKHPSCTVQVHVITDNETIAKQGQGRYSRKTNEEIWAGIDCVIRRGYTIHWHWVARDRLGLNRLTDHLSREARLAVSALQPPAGCSIYDYNPAEPTNERQTSLP